MLTLHGTHRSSSFLERGEATGWQRQECFAFDLLEEFANLLFVVPWIRVSATDFSQLSRNSFCSARLLKVLPFKAFSLAYFTPASTFVFRLARLRRQDHRAIVLGERLQLGMHFGIVPVGSGDSRFGIVDDESLGRAAEVVNCVLDAGDEVVGRLPPRPKSPTHRGHARR